MASFVNLKAQSVDCQGTITMWSLTNSWYAANCYCPSSNALPVCNFGASSGVAGNNDALGIKTGYHDFGRVSLFNFETANPFFTLRYGDGFADWQEEAQERWKSYLIRNKIAKEAHVAI